MSPEGAPETGLAARVRELERQIELRDQQLEVRAAVIRRLRKDLADAHQSYERIVRSRPYQLANFLRRAARVRRPREFVLAVRKRGQRIAVKRAPKP